MEEAFKQYDKFLNAKLYLIEHEITYALRNDMSVDEYKELLKDLRNICYDGYKKTVERYAKTFNYNKGQ